MTMSGLLYWFKPTVPGLQSEDEFTDKFLTAIGYGCLLLVILNLLLVLKLMLTSQDNLRNSYSNKRFGFLYKNLRTDSAVALFFNVLFNYRRIVVCFVYLFLVDFPALQI